MRTTKHSRQWSRWAGAYADIESASEHLAASFREWTSQEPPAKVTVAFPGRVVESDTLEGFGSLVDIRDLQLLQSMRVEIGELASGPRATIHLERKSPALTFEIAGDDATRVGGLFADVGSTLDRGRSSVPFMSVETAAALSALVVALVATAALFLAGVLQADSTDAAGRARPLNYVLILIVVVLTVVGYYLPLRAWPVLEVLPPGRNPSSVRMRGFLIGFVVAVAASVVAALVYGAMAPR